MHALEKSDNSVFARMTEHLDLIQLAYTYRKFNLWDSNVVHPSICLGALPSGVPLLRIASAYSALALNGAYREPNFIRGCLTQTGHIMPFKTQEFKIIADFKTVGHLKIALRHAGIKLDNLIFSGKTGTTKTGSLFAGYNDQVSLALWLDYKKALPESSPKAITSRNVVEKILNRLLGYRSGYLFEIG